MVTKRTSKISELIFGLSLRDDFQEDIYEIRKKFEIPPLGFNTEQERLNVLKKNKKIFVLSPEHFYLLKKYHFPPANSNVLINYLYFNLKKINNISQNDLMNDITEVLDTSAYLGDKVWPRLENLYRESGCPFVALYILDGATSKGVQRFISNNWEKIKSSLDEQRQHEKKRFRKTIYKKDIRRIVELSKKSKDELKEICKRTSILPSSYKYITISNILKREGMNKSPEHVKTVISKHRKGKS